VGFRDHVLDQVAHVLGHRLDRVEHVLEHVAHQVRDRHAQAAGGLLQRLVELLGNTGVQDPLLSPAAPPLAFVLGFHVRHCITMYHGCKPEPL